MPNNYLSNSTPDNLLSGDYSNSKQKIRTHSAKIIVERSPEKPCYSILYFDSKTKEYHIGSSSYDIQNYLSGFMKNLKSTKL